VGNEGQDPHAALELVVDPLQAGDLCLERGAEQVEGESCCRAEGAVARVVREGQASPVHFGAISLCLMPASDLA